jgi:hypothetical protein
MPVAKRGGKAISAVSLKFKKDKGLSPKKEEQALTFYRYSAFFKIILLLFFL